MAESNEKLFAATAAELSRLQDELRGLASARFALARFEAQVALSHVKRLVLSLAVAAVLVLAALPVLVVAAAEALAGYLDIDRTGWLLIAFSALIVVAVLTAGIAWSYFRRHFVGFEETLEVLREDQAWVESLAGRKK